MELSAAAYTPARICGGGFGAPATAPLFHQEVLALIEWSADQRLHLGSVIERVCCGLVLLKCRGVLPDPYYRQVVGTPRNLGDGSAKLSAKGKVTQNHAHGVFAMKGDNYSYNIKAQFDDAKGTGIRDEGAGILGRSCTFEFVKQPDAPPASTSPAPTAEYQTVKCFSTARSTTA
jgi:hypothetical protein